MNKNKHLLFNIAMTVVCFLFILCASIFLVLLLKPLYSLDMKLLKIPKTSGYSAEICRRNYSVLIDYNMFWGPKTLNFPDFVMSENGAVHFAEVKTIFVTAQITAILSGVLLAIGYMRAKQIGCFGWLPGGIALTLAMVAVVGIGCAFFWEKTFVLMHHILFRNDFWLFDPSTDPVIMILPDQVFLHLGAAIMCFMVILMIIAWVVYRKNAGKRSGKSAGRKKTGRKS